LPTGNAGKSFINELTFWLKQLNSSNSKLNSIAMKAFMVIPALILQKPSRTSKAKDHTIAVERRMKEWKNGEIAKLLKDAKAIQLKLKSSVGKVKTPAEIAKLFARLIMHGKIGAAMKLLDKESCSSVLPLSEDTIKGLKAKHPDPGKVSDDSLLRGPVDQLPASFVEGINEQLIMKASLRTKGSSGPSGLDADVFRRILCSKNFSTAGKGLREEIATFTRNLLTVDYDPSLIQPLTSCRLIPLNKDPGIRPIGVGEVLRRIMGKAVSWSFKDEIKEAAGPLQTCAGHGAGAEAAIHSMREMFNDPEAEAVILIDATNAFNSMNRMAALHNIQVQCPQLAKYLINTYRMQSRLFISGGGEIASVEGTTQGDPLAMPWYSITTELIITALRRFIERIKMVWLADDASAVGKLKDLLAWYKRLCIIGEQFGYYVNGSKSWLIVKSEDDVTRAKDIFGELVNITSEGKRHLGAALGSKSFKDAYCTKKVSNWTAQMKVLTEIAKTHPQSAYVGFTKGFVSKLTYFLRTIEGFEEYTDILQEVISDAFIPSLMGESTPLPIHLNNLFTLPGSKGGLGIQNIKEEASLQFAASLQLTSAHRETIKAQDTRLRDTNSEGFDQSTLRSQYKTLKEARLKGKTAAVLKALPEPSKPFMKQSQDVGASSWLNAIPKEEEDWVLSKQEFRDAVKVRYNLPIPDLPSFCVCKDRPAFTVQHAQQCSKGGFINQRHDILRDFFITLLNQVCTNVKAEPHLTKLSGEEFRYKTAITGDEARADIRCRNFWRRGQDAYFDVSFCNVNAPSNQGKETEIIFEERGQSKKREYVERIFLEHGTFTTLIWGTNGGMGKEASRFMKQLATLLSIQRNEEFNITMTWLRAKVSFICVRSALLCIRGSRKPWYKENPMKVSDDFGLCIYEADLAVTMEDEE